MTDTKSDRVKKIVLLCLLAAAALLVYRNVIAPSMGTPAGSPPMAAARNGAATGQAKSAPARAGRSGNRREIAMDREELAALDPTLRIDLLEKAAQVSYKGSGRSIFQFYTPPPKPVVSPVVAPPVTPNPQGEAQPAPPPQPSIALKFYGTSSKPGTNEKKAFLTDGDQIYIGSEGEVVAKRYKIVRIGVSVLDWQDTQSQQSGQLPLLQE